MIPYKKVYEQVSRIATLDYITMHDITYYCDCAIAVLSSRMKADADASDIRLVMAAAALAYCRYLQSTCIEDSDVTSMKAGDVTVARNTKTIVENAQIMAEKAIEDARELLNDTQFIFTAV